jgi:hypothetical protein|tara:strand:- start:509 stop:706 length:198 start_codon:yes stop_codon:yes gene_type:complete
MTISDLFRVDKNTGPDRIGAVLLAWQNLLNIRLSRDRVAKHLKDLEKWQAEWESPRRTPDDKGDF